MPYRKMEFKSKIQFVAPLNWPSLINRAADASGATSQTRYIQLALCRQLAADTDWDYQDLVDSLPPTRGTAAVMFGSDRKPLKRPTAPRPGRS